MIKVKIDSIRGGLMNSQFVVILKDELTERYLPIWIGPSEANAIAIKLRGDTLPRPLTHDLLLSIIETLGASIDYIVVNDLKNDTFYAEVVLIADGRSISIDSRPSDAIALAVRANAPVYVEEAVLERASITLDHETGRPVMPDEKSGEEGGEVSEEELKRLSAFKDFIDNIDLGNLGQDKT